MPSSSRYTVPWWPLPSMTCISGYSAFSEPFQMPPTGLSISPMPEMTRVMMRAAVPPIEKPSFTRFFFVSNMMDSLWTTTSIALLTPSIELGCGNDDAHRDDQPQHELLMPHILEFFRTGQSPVPVTETVEIMAFLEGIDALVKSRVSGSIPASNIELTFPQRKKNGLLLLYRPFTSLPVLRGCARRSW
jgi:hypothetical protein